MATQTTAIGRFVDNPVERAYGASNEGKMALFSLAVDTGKDETQFYDCIAFGKTAENILKYFVKGRPINVTGIMQNNNQEREINGQKYTNYGMTFLVRHFTFLPTDNTQNNANQAAPAQQQQQGQVQQGFGGQQAAPAQQATPQTNPFAGFDTGGFDTTGADGGAPF